MTALPTTIIFDDKPLSVIDHNGQPWLAATTLARALGYRDRSAITRIYAKHASEFTAAMTCAVKTTAQVDQAREVRVFSPRGCHLIAMFARTERAAAFRRWVLDVLEGLSQSPATDPMVAPDQSSKLPNMSPATRELLRGWLETVLERFCGKPPAEMEVIRLRGVLAHMQGDLRQARLAMSHAETRCKSLNESLPAATQVRAVGMATKAETKVASTESKSTSKNAQAAFKEATATIERVLGESPK